MASRRGARLGDEVVWSLTESCLGGASYLERVLLVMDTPVYRVPLQFGQLMMTLLYRVMVVSWLSVLVVAMPVGTLVQQARSLIMSGTHGHVFLELCCASDSELAAAAVEHSVAIRVTSSEDLQLASTRCALHRLLRICKAYDVVVEVWVSIPCTAGTPFRRINEKRGAETGDLSMTYKLLVAAVGLCRHACANWWRIQLGVEQWQRALGLGGCEEPLREVWQLFLFGLDGGCGTTICRSRGGRVLRQEEVENRDNAA